MKIWTHIHIGQVGEKQLAQQSNSLSLSLVSDEAKEAYNTHMSIARQTKMDWNKRGFVTESENIEFANVDMSNGLFEMQTKMSFSKDGDLKRYHTITTFQTDLKDKITCLEFDLGV